MATYYPGSSSQRDVIPTLCPLNSYVESALPGNLMYISYSTTGAYSDGSFDHRQCPQNCAEIPVADSVLSQDSLVDFSKPTSSCPDTISSSVASPLGVNISNVWQGSRNEMFVQPRVTLTGMQSIGEQINSSGDLVGNTDGVNPEERMRTHLHILQNEQNLQMQQEDVTTVQGKGLSLSLGSQMPSLIPVSSFRYRQENPDIASCKDDKYTGKSSDTDPSVFGRSDHITKGDFSSSFLLPVMKQMHMNPSPYGVTNFANVVTNSRYLKAAQKLLDEVVNVRNALKPETNKNRIFKMSIGTSSSKEREVDTDASGNPLPAGDVQESAPSAPIELSTAERQELHMKLAQLMPMLDEIDRRYRQYYHQMQIVVSSFDAVAGRGAAKTYTALALQTISRHFRCLRDAISGQIRACRQRLREEEPPKGQGGGITRLGLLDQQLRQQKSLQQLGMTQQHAWRPQRGLPESSVSILRAWLFEHFLHPYPNDSDKLMLSRQTGLSRSQVSNWFINARVRLWKPMVEEMYKEEIGDTEVESNCSSENAPKEGDGKGDPKERELQENTEIAANRKHASQKNGSTADLRTVGETCGTPEFNCNMHAEDTINSYGNTRLSDPRHITDRSDLQDVLLHSDTGDRFISYHMAGLGRYENDAYAANVQSTGGISLTLGLQHCDMGGVVSVPSEQNFVTLRGGNMYDPAPAHTNTSDYEGLNVGNRRYGLVPPLCCMTSWHELSSCNNAD